MIEGDTLSKGIQEINLSAVVSECNNIGKSKRMVYWYWCYPPHLYTQKYILKLQNNDLRTTIHEIFYKFYNWRIREGYIEDDFQQRTHSQQHSTCVRYSQEPCIKLLSTNGFKLVFVYDKFVLTKNELYIGKWYLCERMFKIKVLAIVSK